MSLLQRTCAAIVPPEVASARAAQALLDGKTKPRRSLGRLEELACRLAAIARTPTPSLPQKAIVVMAADHGVADEGVSAYPSEVTAQMVRNFATGGAAINVLARQAEARVVVVDMGTRGDAGHASNAPCPSGTLETCPTVIDRRLGPGTANFTRGPAMPREAAIRAIETGIALANDLVDAGIGVIGLGDMGIGNTTASSAITTALMGVPASQVTGRGTGIDLEQQARKIAVVERALAANRPDPADPVDVLAKVGGFEIAGLAGVALGGAARRVPVVLDGFITAAAALIAVRLCPMLRGYLIASHRSVEPGHGIILRDLDLEPLLDLNLRLGEGTGAALALHLIDAALRILLEMATFDAANVTDTGA
ncbi:nicotinate-nucleotide--dimethylbenzimidazole phosphoribosyltransferase [Planctomycetaceae bacterium SCGC AG-212-D15]|nr:nicotinate-nucleotide--dimethylbenzimidazole phosphoribosyltransferase [Planctomycetaceae bacterium SCGC AG-212-D15]